MNDKPTIKEIARIANVSVGTVDRVLHDRGEVSKKTRELVRNIMNDLNYVPNTYARNLALNKVYNVAVLLPEHNKGEYWSAPIEGAQKAKEDFKSLGVKVNLYLYNQYISNSFQKVCRNVFSDKNNAVIMARVLYEETNTFLNACSKKGLPYIITGTIQNDMDSLSNIGQNAFQSGRLAAELLQMGQKADASYLIVNLTKAENPNYNVKHRIEGFNDYFISSGYNNNIPIFTIPQEDRGLTLKLRETLKKFVTLDGIFVPNSKSFLLEKAMTNKKDIRIIGYDLLDSNKTLLKDGKIDVLINQRSDEQVYQGIEYLYKYLTLQQRPPSVVSLPLDIVTREKLMYY